jgi:hypothetical protein
VKKEQHMQPVTIGFLVGGICCLLALWAARGKWDLIGAHARDLVRHVLAGILLLGTLAGTVWTFSNGALTLAGAWERLVSVGGIALALEAGLIYCGWYIGQLDMRIFSARKKEQALEFRSLQRSLYRWFFATAGISAVANVIFRIQQLGNIWLATFVSLAPIVLVILLTIKLRPLPVDYAELGRQATQRGLVVLVKQAQSVMLSHLRRMGRGEPLTEAQAEQLAMAASLLRTYAQTQEQHALDYAIGQRGGRGEIEGSVEVYLTSGDLMRLYDISLRSAQVWLSQAPGRRRAPKGNAWQAPASAIYAAHGVPLVTQTARPTRLLQAGSRTRSSRSQRSVIAGSGSVGVTEPLMGAENTPEGEEDPQDLTGEILAG